MTLLDCIQRIDALPDDSTIYAKHPWMLSSEAKCAVEGSQDESLAKAAGLRYFLEVSIAREFLQDWRPSLKDPPTLEICCERLIEYAIHDA
ncbi:hypothetical protein DB347_22745 [Opitutaceae bacterium EW11]|nr:hypothetical protein DB347_22745 [Opitutaceae bacterium EW11]